MSWATWLLFTGVLARCVMWRVWCPWPLGSCSLVCSPGALCCVCDVLVHLAPVHRCVRSACCIALAVSSAKWLLFLGVLAPCVVPCFACAVLWATWLLFTGVLAQCVVLCLRCPGPLDSCSAVCLLGVLCCVCGVLGHFARVHQCADGCVALHFWCPGPLGSCSPVLPLGAWCCVCGVSGHLAPVHRCARSVRCVACAVSWASGPLFTGVHAWCLVLCV